MNWCHGNCWQEQSYKGTQLNSWMPRRRHYCHYVIRSGRSSLKQLIQQVLDVMIERIQSRDSYQDAQWHEISASEGDCWQDYGILSLHLCLQEHSGPSHCCVEGGTCPGQCNKLESPKLLTPEYKQFPVKRLHGDLTLTAAWCDHKYAKVALPQMVARGLHWHVWVSGS
jgi:hypothetical protein